VTNLKSILDAACGSRMFWMDKHNPNVEFMDNRQYFEKLSTGHVINVDPTTIGDFRNMPFPDNSFHLVVWDPPHLIHAGKTSWLAKKYGTLNQDTWQSDLSKGFAECMRVLKPHGTLIFKWNTDQIPMNKVLQCFDQAPLFGDKRSKTRWLVFMKESDNR
jgi:ubiquinone/menaquinone biosynthesis C-methylase UbiE